MEERLRERLAEIGLKLTPADDAQLRQLICEATRWILAETAQRSLPFELEGMAIDMAAGEYMLLQKGRGLLEEFDAEPIVRQMSQGDTSVAYAVSNEMLTPLDAVIAHLLTPCERLLRAWRRMRW